MALGLSSFALAEEMDPYDKYLILKQLFTTYEVDAPSSTTWDSVMKELLETNPELFDGD